ncbi:MAG: ABC transporter permease [Clostridiales bacterium]|nr:ABC transporter permease [Clostridiales bacterium]
MKSTFILWKLELKRMIKLMPSMLFEACILLLILAAVAFGAGKLLYQDSPLIRINIAVIEEEENPLTDMAVNYIQGMESIAEHCSFNIVTKEEGFKLLNEGNAAAVLYLPAGMIEGIMNGNNVPVQVFFPENAGIESALLKELTDAGLKMLRVAQAEIYGIYDTAKEYDTLDMLSVMETDIDMYNLAFALDRLALYEIQQVSATGSLNFGQYMAASGAVFFLMLMGMTCYPMMQPYPAALRAQLKRSEIGLGKQCFGKWLCGLCSIAISAAFFLLIVKSVLKAFNYSEWLPTMSLGQIGTAVVILICISTFIFMIFQMAANGSAAILALFFISMIMQYFSGGILPSAFLPAAVWNVGKLLPTKYLIEAAGSMYTGAGSFRVIGILLGFTAAFGIVAYIAAHGTVAYAARGRSRV